MLESQEDTQADEVGLCGRNRPKANSLKIAMGTSIMSRLNFIAFSLIFLI